MIMWWQEVVAVSNLTPQLVDKIAQEVSAMYSTAKRTTRLKIDFSTLMRQVIMSHGFNFQEVGNVRPSVSKRLAERRNARKWRSRK